MEKLIYVFKSGNKFGLTYNKDGSNLPEEIGRVLFNSFYVKEDEEVSRLGLGISTKELIKILDTTGFYIQGVTINFTEP